MNKIKRITTICLMITMLFALVPCNTFAYTLKSDYYNSDTTLASLQSIEGEYTICDTIWLNCFLPQGYENARISVGDYVVKRFYGSIEKSGSYKTELKLSEYGAYGENIPVSLTVVDGEVNSTYLERLINIRNIAGYEELAKDDFEGESIALKTKTNTAYSMSDIDVTTFNTGVFVADYTNTVEYEESALVKFNAGIKKGYRTNVEFDAFVTESGMNLGAYLKTSGNTADWLWSLEAGKDFPLNTWHKVKFSIAGNKIYSYIDGAFYNSSSLQNTGDIGSVGIAVNNGTLSKGKIYIDNATVSKYVIAPHPVNITVGDFQSEEDNNVNIKVTMSDAITISADAVRVFVNGVEKSISSSASGKEIEIIVEDHIDYSNGYIVIDTTAKEITYGRNISLPIVVPVTFNTIKNINPNIESDGNLVIEAEDMLIGKNVSIVSDDNASGSKALKLSSEGYTLDSNFDYMARFEVNTVSMYNIWIRMKSNAANVKIKSKLGEKEKDVSFSFSVSNPDYSWKKITSVLDQSAVIKQDIKELIIKHTEVNSDVYIDKIIITSDVDFVPVTKDSVPDKVVGNKTFNQYNITVFPKKGVHPRLYVTEEDIPAIKEKLKSPYYATFIRI